MRFFLASHHLVFLLCYTFLILKSRSIFSELFSSFPRDCYLSISEPTYNTNYQFGAKILFRISFWNVFGQRALYLLLLIGSSQWPLWSSIGRSVCHNFLKRQEVTLACFYSFQTRTVHNRLHCPYIYAFMYVSMSIFPMWRQLDWASITPQS